MKRLRVNRRNPCPTCSRTTWCLLHPQGLDCICPRTPSDKAIYSRETGEFVGYLHVLKPGQLPVNGPARFAAKPDPPRRKDLLQVAQQLRQELTDRRADIIARCLGVTLESLRRLGMGFQVQSAAAAFPMVDDREQVIGIRLRTDDGHKFAIKGSRNGLFVPSGLSSQGPLLWCEGPTSLAALLDLGYDAAARPSCSGGVWLAIQWMRRNAKGRDVVIFGDHDPEKIRPDGSTFEPGQDGARTFAREVLSVGCCRSVKVVIPPFARDARQWKNDLGATRIVVDCVIRAANYIRRQEP